MHGKELHSQLGNLKNICGNVVEQQSTKVNCSKSTNRYSHTLSAAVLFFRLNAKIEKGYVWFSNQKVRIKLWTEKNSVQFGALVRLTATFCRFD